MNTTLWVLQILLALLFLWAGISKATRSEDQLRPLMTWVDDFSLQNIRLLGVAEVLGTLGLILPYATGIAPILTPLAAAALAALMIGAIYTHLRRKEGTKSIFNFVLLALLVFVALGRI